MFVVLLFFKRVDYSLRDARKMQVRFFLFSILHLYKFLEIFPLRRHTTALYSTLPAGWLTDYLCLHLHICPANTVGGIHVML